MANDNLMLAFFYKIGKNKNGDFLYEMVFTKDIDEINGPGWGNAPAFVHAGMPLEKFADKKIRIETDIDFHCLLSEEDENMVYGFSMADAADGIVALAWEKDCKVEERGKLVLRYGAQYAQVKYQLIELEVKIYE